MDGADLGGLVQTAAELLAEFGGGIFFTGGDSSAEFLFDGFKLADAGTVAEIRLFAGAQTFQSRFGVLPEKIVFIGLIFSQILLCFINVHNAFSNS